jgi:hypothetical protein
MLTALLLRLQASLSHKFCFRVTSAALFGERFAGDGHRFKRF